MKLVNFLKKIKKDCLELERNNDLTKYGKGQLNLIKIVLLELD